jgi:hypothetical protein
MTKRVVAEWRAGSRTGAERAKSAALIDASL